MKIAEVSPFSLIDPSLTQCFSSCCLAEGLRVTYKDAEEVRKAAVHACRIVARESLSRLLDSDLRRLFESNGLIESPLVLRMVESEKATTPSVFLDALLARRWTACVESGGLSEADCQVKALSTLISDEFEASVSGLVLRAKRSVPSDDSTDASSEEDMSVAAAAKRSFDRRMREWPEETQTSYERAKTSCQISACRGRLQFSCGMCRKICSIPLTTEGYPNFAHVKEHFTVFGHKSSRCRDVAELLKRQLDREADVCVVEHERPSSAAVGSVTPATSGVQEPAACEDTAITDGQNR
jgi:hypothetical protein